MSKAANGIVNRLASNGRPVSGDKPSTASRTLGAAVPLVTVQTRSGVSMSVSALGATITKLLVPDREGMLDDVVLGFDQPGDYLNQSSYIGGVVGRCANRISSGRFRIDGTPYRVTPNHGPDHLHGGRIGFDRAVWSMDRLETCLGNGVVLTHVSPDGDEGYPGELRARVSYILTEDGELLIEFEGTADAPTVCNLAQHTYWNLGGHAHGRIEDHLLRLHCSARTPSDERGIPLGRIEPTAGTGFDFSSLRPIDPFRGGLDQNYVIDGTPGMLRPAARVVHPITGRVMEVLTDMPGLQVYDGSGLERVRGKNGASYGPRSGFCLETQHHPDAVNHPEWPSPVIRPGQTYRHRMAIRFGVASELDARSLRDSAREPGRRLPPDSSLHEGTRDPGRAHERAAQTWASS